VARIRAHLTAAQVAAKLEVSTQRIYMLEALGAVTEAAAAKYHAAVAAATVERDGSADPYAAAIVQLAGLARNG
jgi:Zn-dependent peptidase ImmA (M78 family)